MAKLTDEEQRTLEALNTKRKAADPPSHSKTLNVNLDLADEKQISVARRMFPGLLEDEQEDDGEEEGSDDEELDDAPKRRSYFE